MSNPRSDDRHDAAYSATGRRKAPLAWLPWAALLLLLILAGIVFLIARNVGDDGDDPGVDVVDDAGSGDENSVGPAGTAAGADQDAGDKAAGSGDPAPIPEASGATTAPAAAAAAGSGPAVSSGAASAVLVAGDQPILPLPTSGLAALAGQAVTGTAVTVESVVADEGFWVGTSPTDRVFVVLTPAARTSQDESPFQVEAGQSINLQGTLIPLAGGPETLGVDPDEGADQLVQQGHLVEATSITLT